jgi:hypothetical protein
VLFTKSALSGVVGARCVRVSRVRGLGARGGLVGGVRDVAVVRLGGRQPLYLCGGGRNNPRRQQGGLEVGLGALSSGPAERGPLR